jgi:hypothetical protein
MSVAFDTLKFARALRDKANMSAEQAEGVAEAFSGATSEQLATKADLDRSVADLRSEISDGKSELRAEIAGVRSELVLVKWMIGFVLALLVAVFGKLFLR